MFTIFVVFLRSLIGLNGLRWVRRQRFKLLKFERIPVKNLLFGAFIYLEKRLMALKATSIHFSDPGRKVGSDFSLRGNGFSDGLFLDVFLATILIGLGRDR